MFALPPLRPAAAVDSQRLSIPVFGADIAEDPSQILGDPWSPRDGDGRGAAGGRPGIRVFSRLARRHQH
jgi:hypothetical protein